MSGRSTIAPILHHLAKSDKGSLRGMSGRPVARGPRPDVGRTTVAPLRISRSCARQCRPGTRPERATGRCQ